MSRERRTVPKPNPANEFTLICGSRHSEIPTFPKPSKKLPTNRDTRARRVHDGPVSAEI